MAPRLSSPERVLSTEPFGAEANGLRYSTRDFQFIADLLRTRTGISLPATKATFVFSRLAPRLRALNISNFKDYRQILTGRHAESEIGVMVNRLTTNLTRFFREPHHFDALRRALAVCGPRIRIWSAGCSTGQEPYSIAMVAAEFLKTRPSVDLRILATDIDTEVLSRAKSGEYDAEDLDGVPAWARNFFEQAGHDRIRIAEPARQLVQFKTLNLIANWPMRGPFDVIFCRNTAIYFDKPVQKRVYGGMARLLKPEGLLCIGHSESLHDLDLGLLPQSGSIWQVPADLHRRVNAADHNDYAELHPCP